MPKRNFYYKGANMPPNKFKSKKINRIVELNDRDKEIFSESYKKWVNIYNSSYTDDEKIKESIKWLYTFFGFKEPKIQIVDGPESYDFNFLNLDNGYNIENLNKFNELLIKKIRDFLLYKIMNKIEEHIDMDILSRIVVNNNQNNRNTMNELQDLIFHKLYDSFAYHYPIIRFDKLLFKYDRYNFSTFCMTNECAMNIIGMKNKNIEKFFDFIKNTGIFGFYTEDLVIISRLPSILHKDELGRYHAEKTAAIQFDDGFKVYMLHGIQMSEMEYNKYVMNKVQPQEILSVQNVDLRTALIQFYGYDYLFNYLPQFKVIDTWKTKQAGTDYDVEYKLCEYEHAEYTTARVIRCEWWEQGHKESVVLGVPITSLTNTCKGALAWTFGMNEEDYNFKFEA